MPILLVPAMHLSMYDHKIVQKNIDICKEHGVLFLDPFISGNKAKSPEIQEIVEDRDSDDWETRFAEEKNPYHRWCDC